MMLHIHIMISRTISVMSLTALLGTIGAATTISNTAVDMRNLFGVWKRLCMRYSTMENIPIWLKTK